MFLKIEGYFHMSLTCFDRNKQKNPTFLYLQGCLSAGVEKEVSVDVSMCAKRHPGSISQTIHSAFSYFSNFVQSETRSIFTFSQINIQASTLPVPP